MTSVVLTVKDRLTRALTRLQRGQLVAGMILADERATLSAAKYAKLVKDTFTYATRDPKTGKQVTKWHYPETSIGRWVNAGAVALVLGFTTGDDDEGSEDLPTMAVLAPLFAILKTGKDLEDGEALTAIHDTVRDAWKVANEKFAAGEKKTLLLAVESEVARRTKKKTTKKKSSDPNTPADDNADENNVEVSFDPAAVVALRPTMDAWIRGNAEKFGTSRVRLHLLMLEAVRFCSEHGTAVVAAALMPDTEPNEGPDDEK